MSLRNGIMAIAAVMLLAGNAQAADAYFTDIKTGGDMDAYAFNVIKTPSIEAALKKLLGRDYEALAARIETAGPVERTGDITCGNGLMAHNGGSNEAIFCVDHATGVAQAGIMTEQKIVFHTGGATPYGQLAAWKDRIIALRKGPPAR